MAKYTLMLKKGMGQTAIKIKREQNRKQASFKKIRTALHWKDTDEINSEQPLNSLCTKYYSKSDLPIILSNWKIEMIVLQKAAYSPPQFYQDHLYL